MYAPALLLSLPLLAAAPPASDNPCTNGSFEQLAPGGFPTDWAPIGSTVEVSTDAHSGKRALRFRRAKGTETAETGLNRGPLIKQLKGGMDFWYKAVSARDAKLNIYVIPMTDEPREGTGSPRAALAAPEGHVGDGRWHHARLKYDFTDNPKVKWVHFAVRIVGAEGELLLDDVSYVERVGKVLRFGKIEIKEDAEKPGERCAVRAQIENAGDAPAEAVRAEMVSRAVRDAAPSALDVGDLAPDEKRSVEWAYEGERTAPLRLQFTAASGDEKAETSLTLAPQLVLRSFGPAAPVVEQNSPLALTCVLENPGTASLVNPTAVFQLPAGPVRRAAKHLHPGQTVSFSTIAAFGRQTPKLPIGVRVSADNIDEELTAESSLVVGSATRVGPPGGTLNAAVTEDFAILENEHLRLVFRRNGFGFGPAELSVCGAGGRPATVAWLPRLGRVVLQAADGSRREHVVLTDSPPSARTGGQASLEFAWSTPPAEEPGCQVRVRLELAKAEKSIAADYTLVCSHSCKLLAFDGPMLYALDRDEAVFPGLEWLVGDEVSSGTLDIAKGHPDQVRYVVHPNMVTIPAVGIHGSRGAVGLVWDVRQNWDRQRDRPSVVFASPDRFESQRSHLVGLFLPSVPEFVEANQREAARPYPLGARTPLRLAARIFADAGAADALAAVDQWALLYGFPAAAQLPHLSYDYEIQFSMRAYLDSLWYPQTQDWWTTKGGGMMSKRDRPPMFVADLLLGAMIAPSDGVRFACRARAAEVLAKIGGDARIDAQRFRGRADLAMADPAKAASILASCGEDGAWRFDADQAPTTGPFVGKDYHELGPDEAVEVGTCAQRAFEVLRYARIAGDPAAYEAMRKTLVLMESFRVPRAAQVWEVPVHAPDVLAAADAVDAYVEAYRFSGQERWRRDAAAWARRGLPFIYLWSDPEKPFFVGASIPVFGATWRQGSWFGRPVQWNGLRYANALLKLAEYDQSYPWVQIAGAIIHSAIRQQDLDGENAALWPDNISVIDGKKCPWVFAPREIIRNVLKLTGRDEDPSTVIVGEGERRLHVSATAKISDAAWDGRRLTFRATYPPGEQGMLLVSNVARPEKLLLDGQPIAPRDEIETGPQPGWRYDETNAFLAIRVTRDGPLSIEVLGAGFRPVRRLPLPAKRIAFEFDQSTEGWTPAHDIASLRVSDGALAGKITGPDPYVIRTLIRASGDACPVIRLRMRATAGKVGQLFWTTESSPGFSEEKSIRFAIQPDGELHEYRLEPGRNPAWAGQTITAVRVDPGGGAASGEFAIDSICGEKTK